MYNLILLGYLAGSHVGDERPANIDMKFAPFFGWPHSVIRC